MYDVGSIIEIIEDAKLIQAYLKEAVLVLPMNESLTNEERQEIHAMWYKCIRRRVIDAVRVGFADRDAGRQMMDDLLNNIVDNKSMMRLRHMITTPFE